MGGALIFLRFAYVLPRRRALLPPLLPSEPREGGEGVARCQTTENSLIFTGPVGTEGGGASIRWLRPLKEHQEDSFFVNFSFN